MRVLDEHRSRRRTPDGRTATTMHELAEETGCWIAGSFPEHTAGHDRPTNRFLLAGPNGEDHRYSKTKPFSFAGETDHYDGGTPVEPIVVDGVRDTYLSSHDQLHRTSSGTRRRTPTCISFRPIRLACRGDLMTLPGPGDENQAYVRGVNRVGTTDGPTYTGDYIFNPLGEPLAEAPSGSVHTMRATIDPAKVAEVRSTFRFMNDRWARSVSRRSARSRRPRHPLEPAAETDPPWASATCLTIARPRPEPGIVRVASTRWNRSKILDRSASGMPGPASRPPRRLHRRRSP